MASEDRTERDGQFTEALVSKLNEAWQLSRLAADPVLKKVQSLGGIQAARDELHPVYRGGKRMSFVSVPRRYFSKMRSYGRLDLTVQALVLTGHWSDLFTDQERERAADALEMEGFDRGAILPQPETQTVRTSNDVLPITALPGDSLRYLWELDQRGIETECELTAHVARELRQGRHCLFGKLRNHLRTCRDCREAYPEILQAFEQVDRSAISTIDHLAKRLVCALDFSENRVEQLIDLPPEDVFEDQEDLTAKEQFENEKAVAVEVSQPYVAWREVRLGYFLGAYMHRFARFQEVGPGQWEKWRRENATDEISRFVRNLTNDEYMAALMGQHIFYSLMLPDETELWLPSDGDIEPMPGVLAVEKTENFGEWEEVVGEPPAILNPMNLVLTIHKAAAAVDRDVEIVRQSIDGVQVLQILEEIRTNATVTRHVVEDIDERTDAIVLHLESMVPELANRDRSACEQALLDVFGDVWRRVSASAREFLLASEQVRRTRDCAAPSAIVAMITQAFELHLKEGLLGQVHEWLKQSGVPTLYGPLREVVYQSCRRPTRMTLGGIEHLFRNTHPSIEEFVTFIRIDRDTLLQAIRYATDRRNPAHHDATITFFQAEEFRSQLLQFNGLRGGVFGATVSIPPPP